MIKIGPQFVYTHRFYVVAAFEMLGDSIDTHTHRLDLSRKRPIRGLVLVSGLEFPPDILLFRLYDTNNTKSKLISMFSALAKPDLASGNVARP